MNSINHVKANICTVNGMWTDLMSEMEEGGRDGLSLTETCGVYSVPEPRPL